MGFRGNRYYPGGRPYASVKDVYDHFFRNRADKILALCDRDDGFHHKSILQ